MVSLTAITILGIQTNRKESDSFGFLSLRLAPAVKSSAASSLRLGSAVKCSAFSSL